MCYARSCVFNRVSTYSRDLNKLAARKSEKRSRRVRQSPQNSMKSPTVLLITLACVSQSALAVATYTGGIYAENFDGEHARDWVQDSTLPGWFAYQGAGIGGSQGQPDPSWTFCNVFAKSEYGGLLNLGTSNASLSRSLGSQNGSVDIAFALVLRNDTPTTFTDFTLSYFGEQWRASGFLTPNLKLDFSFGVFPSFSADPNDIYDQTIIPQNDGMHFYDGYTNPAGGALDVSPIVFGQSNGFLDGTDPQNRQFISSNQPFVWAPGEYLILRWFDDHSTGTIDAMLAINDLQFEARAVPEPSAALLACTGVGFVLLRRWARISTKGSDLA